MNLQYAILFNLQTPHYAKLYLNERSGFVELFDDEQSANDFIAKNNINNAKVISF